MVLGVFLAKAEYVWHHLEQRSLKKEFDPRSEPQTSGSVQTKDNSTQEPNEFYIMEGSSKFLGSMHSDL